MATAGLQGNGTPFAASDDPVELENHGPHRQPLLRAAGRQEHSAQVVTGGLAGVRVKTVSGRLRGVSTIEPAKILGPGVAVP